MNIEYKLLAITFFLIGCSFFIVSSTQEEMWLKIADIILGLISSLCAAYVVIIKAE